jgi:hypothetical protein
LTPFSAGGMCHAGLSGARKSVSESVASESVFAKLLLTCNCRRLGVLVRLDSYQLLAHLEFCYISPLSAAAAPRFASICYVFRGALFRCVCLLMSVCRLCIRAVYLIDFCGVKLARK